MLTSIRQVNEEFFRTFYGLKVTVGGVEKTILCRYARKSSNDYVEEQENQIYPCIAIQDYTPTLKNEWYVDMKPYIGGKSLDGLTAFLFMRPIWMEFRYDVSIAAKSYNDFLALQDYFMENFVYGVRLMFNKQLSGDDLVGAIVPYTIRENYIPRIDGVYEINYEFTCSVWVQPQKPKEVSLVQEIIINGHPTDFDAENTGSIMERITISTEPKFKVIITPYDGRPINGNSNNTRLGYVIVVGDVAELLREDVSGFSVELYKGKELLDKGTTGLSGIVELLLPKDLGEYMITLSKEGHTINANFSLKEINSNLVFLWVFE